MDCWRWTQQSAWRPLSLWSICGWRLQHRATKTYTAQSVRIWWSSGRYASATRALGPTGQTSQVFLCVPNTDGSLRRISKNFIEIQKSRQNCLHSAAAGQKASEVTSRSVLSIWLLATGSLLAYGYRVSVGSWLQGICWLMATGYLLAHGYRVSVGSLLQGHC